MLNLLIFYTCEHLKFYAQLVEHEKCFMTSGPGLACLFVITKVS